MIFIYFHFIQSRTFAFWHDYDPFQNRWFWWKLFSQPQAKQDSNYAKAGSHTFPTKLPLILQTFLREEKWRATWSNKPFSPHKNTCRCQFRACNFGLCRGETRQRPKEVNGDRPPQKVMCTSKPCCKILFYQQVKRSKSGQINDFVGKTTGFFKRTTMQYWITLEFPRCSQLHPFFYLQLSMSTVSWSSLRQPTRCCWSGWRRIDSMWSRWSPESRPQPARALPRSLDVKVEDVEGEEWSLGYLG